MDTDGLVGTGVGLLGLAVVVTVAGKALKVIDKIPKPKKSKGGWL